MVKVGLFVRIEAKPEKEREVENFLKSGLSLVENEPATAAWFAFKIPQSDSNSAVFGIFDVFPNDAGRQAHLAGELAKQLMSKASDLLVKPPEIHRLDVLANKMPI